MLLLEEIFYKLLLALQTAFSHHTPNALIFLCYIILHFLCCINTY